MSKKFIAILIFFAISPFVLAANPTEEEIKAALDDAKTIADVERYEQKTAFHWQKNAIESVAPENVDEAKTQALHDLGKMQIAAGERVLAIARSYYDSEIGYTFKMKGQQNLISWAKQKNDNEKELQYWREFGVNYAAKIRIAFTLEYSDFLTEKVSPFRIILSESNFSLEKFNEAVEGLKEWSIKGLQTNPSSPLMLAIDIAEWSGRSGEEPQFASRNVGTAYSICSIRRVLETGRCSRKHGEQIGKTFLTACRQRPETFRQNAWR